MTGAELRAWRERLRLTQAQAAHHLGLAVTKDGSTSDAVRSYERDRRAIPDSVALLARYVELFGPLQNP